MQFLFYFGFNCTGNLRLKYSGILQGSKRDKKMTDKLMYIPNNNKQKYLFC